MREDWDSGGQPRAISESACVETGPRQLHALLELGLPFFSFFFSEVWLLHHEACGSVEWAGGQAGLRRPAFCCPRTMLGSEMFLSFETLNPFVS